MSHDDMITIHADILQLTDAAVLVECEGEDVWLPLSQIDFCGDRGDTNVPITLPEWLGDDKGLSDGDGLPRATITDIRTGLPKHDDDGKNCRNCALLVLADDENAPMPPECLECTRSGLVGGSKDNWTDNGEEPELPSDPPDTTRITLTMIEFSEDGETVLTEDRHGNRWELSTLDFLQDSEDLDQGDTVLCYVQNSALAAEGCTLRPDEPEAQDPADEDDEGDVDTPLRPAEPAYLKTETITVSIPLDIEERESVGDRMASALEKISELEDDLDSYRKSINAEIKSLQKDAEKARKEWQEGKIEQEVYCDVMADYGQEAIIWLDHDTGKEMKRRAMTAEERQYRLPIPRPGDNAAATPAEPADQRPAPVAMGTPKTCITCGSLANRDGDDLPETCQSCAQANNGEEDNWHPIRECRTCTNSHTQVNMPPCAGCALNVEESQRGETDAWEWKDEDSTADAAAADEADGAPESAPEESCEGGPEAPSGEVEEEPEAEENIPLQAEAN